MTEEGCVVIGLGIDGGASSRDGREDTGSGNHVRYILSSFHK